MTQISKPVTNTVSASHHAEDASLYGVFDDPKSYKLRGYWLEGTQGKHISNLRLNHSFSIIAWILRLEDFVDTNVR